VPLLEQAEDHACLVRVWWALAYHVANNRGRYEEMARASEEALRHARLAGQPSGNLFMLDMAVVYGPRPADEALRALDAVLPEAADPGALAHRAWLLAMLGRFEEAWLVGREAGDRRRELTGWRSCEAQLSEIATLAGDHEAAVGYLQSYCKQLEQRGERAVLSTYASRLGRSLCALERYDEAEPWAKRGSALGDQWDIATQTWWRSAQALVCAHRGQHADAELVAREAVSIVASTDALNFQGDALCDLAEVLAAAGRTEEAAEALKQALERYERKKNLAMVAQVRPKVESLSARGHP
jgi:tetratricopeptide (TPR) repeat protein